MHVFISYTDRDRQYVSNLIIELKRLSISVWSNQDLLPGEDKIIKTQQKIQSCSAFIVIVSPNSASSKEVAREVQVAERNKKIVAPILYGDLKVMDLPIWIGNRTYADARNGKNPIADIKRTLDAINNNNSFSFENINNQSNRRIKRGHLSEQKIKLIKVSAGGRIDGNRIGIHPSNSFESNYGLFTSFPNDTDNVRKKEISVKVLQEEEIPKGCLFIGEYLLNELGITDALDSPWDLQLTGLNVIKVDEITLELTTETPIEQAVNALALTADLTGRLIWLPNGINQEQIIDIDQQPYRIKEISPTPSNTNTLLEIRSSTSLSLFSSGIKSGVDMVILADTSGSMSVNDLTDSVEPAITESRFSFFRRNNTMSQSLSRMDALKKSLIQLLEMRLKIKGRISKVALVDFSSDCSIRFPRKGEGMASIDGNSEDHVIQEFKSAIGLLQAWGGTNIGKALHFAAELLYQHGVPGNKRLIVLISDGASWTPKGVDSTGEVVTGIEDEVGLMDNLYRTMEIHLHAIGISNLELYNKWVRTQKNQGNIHWMPNHDLLEKLMIVGGGDVSRIGNSNVIAEYFSGLGKGITRKVNCPRAKPIPSFQRSERELMHKYKVEKEIIEESAGQIKKRAELAGKIWELVIDVNGQSDRVTGNKLLNNDGLEFLNDIQKRTDNSQSFITFIQKIRKSTVDFSRSREQEHPAEIKQAFRKSENIQMVRAIERKFLLIKEPNQSTPAELNSELEFLINIKIIKANDVKKWRELQIAILETIKSILSDIHDIYDDIIYEQSTSSDSLIDVEEGKEESMFTFMD